jgi:hypothetical protein
MRKLKFHSIIRFASQKALKYSKSAMNENVIYAKMRRDLLWDAKQKQTLGNVSQAFILAVQFKEAL